LHDKVGTLTKLITDVNETFPVYNPVTQTKVGQDASVGQLYALIWSVYMNEAIKRDAALAKAATENDYRVQAEVAARAYDTEAAALAATFDIENAAALDAATALAATKATDEEKALVMAEYDANREIQSTALNASLATLKANYEASKLTQAEAAKAAAKAAYDAIMNE
jgi:hypothetical protein